MVALLVVSVVAACAPTRTRPSALIDLEGGVTSGVDDGSESPSMLRSRPAGAVTVIDGDSTETDTPASLFSGLGAPLGGSSSAISPSTEREDFSSSLICPNMSIWSFRSVGSPTRKPC